MLVYQRVIVHLMNKRIIQPFSAGHFLHFSLFLQTNALVVHPKPIFCVRHFL